MKKYIIIFLLFGSCSEETGPCYEMEIQCKSLLSKMDKATDAKEKEQYYQKYLSEKHLLEYCYKENR